MNALPPNDMPPEAFLAKNRHREHVVQHERDPLGGNDSVALDAGSRSFALTAEEIRRIRHFVIPHAHADHTASLPIFISKYSPPIVHATPHVIDALLRSGLIRLEPGN
jgi:glyoxylase-like metal-dependent hydrolase (beta-lactamase superfamily II)